MEDYTLTRKTGTPNIPEAGLGCAMPENWGSIPFWSWNDRLEPARLTEQIRTMSSQGMAGFIIHARRGLKTEYLSEEWFRCVEACVLEAERLGMEVWLYDENGWPSGFAGGKLLEDPENHVWYLEYKQCREFNRDALAVFVYDQPSPGEQGGTYRLATEQDGCAGPFYTVYARRNPTYVDILNPKVVSRFIHYTHEAYYTRFSRWFGGTIKGFFTDEPQFFRWAQPWSPVMAKAFQAEYGYDIREGLIFLFADGPEAGAYRNDYWKLMNRLLMENYQKTVYDWCTAHRCMVTGHTIEENSLEGQMCGSAGVMTFYEYEHIPGIDCLTRERNPELAARQCASAARQLGKRQVITETYAACGWGISPLQLKILTEKQFSAGVNRINQHLYPYSITGMRKRDYPPFFSPHNPWMAESGAANQYFDRLSRFFGESTDVTETLVIHPLRTAYRHYRFGADTLRTYDEAFLKRVDRWRKDHFLYHFGDETLLSKYARVRDGQLLVGECRYKTVLLPDLETIDRSTAELLRDFQKAGGRICMEDRAPGMVDGRPAIIGLYADVTYKQLLRAQPFRILVNKGAEHLYVRYGEHEGIRYLYLLNSGEDETINAVALLREQAVREWDVFHDRLHSLKYELRRGKMFIRLTLRPGQSRLLCFDKCEDTGCCFSGIRGERSLSNLWRTDEDAENSLVLDTAEISADGITYEKPAGTMELFNRLLRERYAGPLYLRYTVAVREVPDRIWFIMEECAGQEVRVNGLPADSSGAWAYDSGFVRYAVRGGMKQGINRLVVKRDFRQSEDKYAVLFGKDITESMRNCFTFDSELENAFLAGSFGVFNDQVVRSGFSDTSLFQPDFYIDRLKEYVDGRFLLMQGFPFFCGRMRLSQFVDISETGRVMLRLKAHCAVVNVYVNGIYVGQCLYENQLDVTHAVRQGKNELVLELVTTARNRFGPFHHPKEEPYCVGPEDFGEEVLTGVEYHARSDRYALAALSVDSVVVYEEYKPLDGKSSGGLSEN